MKNRQTAIEIFEDNLAFFLKDIIENKNYILMENLFEEAKKEEKKQIIEAYMIGASDASEFVDLDEIHFGERYFKETYGKN